MVNVISTTGADTILWMSETRPNVPHLLTLKLEGWGKLGESTSESEGKRVYVLGGIPGETVVAEVIRERRGYVAAQVTKVLDPSADRVKARCPYVMDCTGCQWQHVSYERQLSTKKAMVKDALARVAGLDAQMVDDVLASPAVFGYRNHARFTVRRSRSDESAGSAIGYVHREKRQHVEVDRCLIMADWINEALGRLKGHVGETSQFSLRYGTNTGDWLLQPTFKSEGFPMESGQKSYRESLLGHDFRVSSPSFFQVNTHQAEQMVNLIIEKLGLTGQETIVDAYAGVGTFAVSMSNHVKYSMAVEESASAIADAAVNVAGIHNVELREAKTEDVLAEVSQQGVDVVIVDPPRTGCMPGTIQALLDYPPKRLVYVSCEPETLARDLASLVAGPFKLESITPVDMFPHTHHIESVSIMVRDDQKRERLAARAHLILASSSPRRHEIFERLGLDFVIKETGVPEPAVTEGQEARWVALDRAFAKARSASNEVNEGTVVGADTVVEIDGTVLGKPAGVDDARRMLQTLRGRSHRVITGVALIDGNTGEERSAYRASRVVMRDYSDREIALYLETGDWFDKAGSYAVQHTLFAPAHEVNGCYLNVVGFPVCTFFKEALRFGLRFKLDDSVASWPELIRCSECVKYFGFTGKGRQRP